MTGSKLEIIAVAILVASIVLTAFSLVATTHESRLLFREREALRREQDRLQDDWTVLVLEVGTLSGHARIDELARDELGMIEPGDSIRFVGVAP